jgi:hypothetical protein
MQKISEKELDKQMNLFMALSCQRADQPSGALNSILSEHRMRILYLSLKELRAESEYQQEVASYARNRMIISIVRDVLIPPLFIFSLVFLPTGVGVPLLIISLSLAIGLYYFLSKTQPKKGEALKDFPEAAYLTFSREAVKNSRDVLKKFLSEDNTVNSESPSNLAPT